MFSRQKKGDGRSNSWSIDNRLRYDTPLDELVASLDRVEEIVKHARLAYEEETNPIEPAPSSGGFSFRSKRSATKQQQETPAETPKKFNVGRHKQANSKFIPIWEEAELIELLRRIAELAIMGEQAVAQAEVQEDERRAHRRQHSDGKVFVPRPEISKPNPNEASNAAMFEHFFERNALALIVNIATGVAFQTNAVDKEQQEETTTTTTKPPKRRDSTMVMIQ